MIVKIAIFQLQFTSLLINETRRPTSEFYHQLLIKLISNKIKSG